MAAHANEIPPGAILGRRYEVQAKLGQGAFSTVYRALDRSLDTPCALKVLHEHATTERSVLERFKREVILSRSVRHEGCCRVDDFLEMDGYAVLTMEYVDGWTLEELLDRIKTVPLGAACSLAAQASSALAALHRHGIIHRDVKARNLMVDRDGRLKLLDLGLSWSAHLTSLTVMGSMLGTPTHMAPERILAGAEPSTRSDVYALGVAYYHLLTGRLPFIGHDLSQLIALHIRSEPVPPRRHRPELGQSVEALILRCLRKKPEDRFADAAEVEAVWMRLLGGPPSLDLVRASLPVRGTTPMEDLAAYAPTVILDRPMFPLPVPRVENSRRFQQDVGTASATSKAPEVSQDGRPHRQLVLALLLFLLAAVATVGSLWLYRSFR